MIDEAVAVLSEAPDIAVVCHIGPDGDAIGAGIGLALAARKAGRSAVFSFGEPFSLSDNYDYLDRSVLIPPAEFPRAPDVLVTVDAASLDRLGSLAPVAEAAGTVVVLDHHISNPGFGDVNVIDPAAAATAELVYLLLRRLQWPVDMDVAAALLTGLVTDTGRFQYSNTTPATLQVAADLVAAGARPDVIGQNMYERVPFGYLKVQAAVLDRAVLSGQFVWSVLYLDDLNRHGIGPEDTDLLIDAIRIAKEAEVAALVKELQAGGFKVSLRSRGSVDVGAIAGAYGGGGHHNAAGFTMAGTLEEVVAAVEDAL